MKTEEMRALYRKWLPELWSASPGDVGQLAEELFTPNAIGHWGNGNEPVGPKSIAENVAETFKLFDDVSVSVVNGPIVDGDLVGARWAFSGRYLGGIPGARAAAGTRVHYTGMDLFRVERDRFAEYWPYGDNMSLMQQLGALG